MQGSESKQSFHEMSLAERLEDVVRRSGLSEDAVRVLRDPQSVAIAESENSIAKATLYIGAVPRIVVNGRARIMPMITDEPSVIAAASNGAKMAEKYGGFSAVVSGTTTLGQVQIVGIPEAKIGAAMVELKQREWLLAQFANKSTPHLVAAGGGLRSITPKRIETRAGPQLILDFEVECRDAMGANAVSKMAEAMASAIEHFTGGKVIGRIVSNLSLGRLVACSATFDKDSLALEKAVDGKPMRIDGMGMVERIVKLSAWSESDQFRAATHNKGIMNGIDAVALALGQDTRALEAAAHSYAAYKHDYGPLSLFESDENCNLHGLLELPIPVGTVGGALGASPAARACLEITQCKSSVELAAAIAAVGLAQDLAALRMLAGEGISSGHLPLHRIVNERRP